MKVFVLIALMLTANFSFAADRTGAFNAICKGLYAETTKLACMQTVKKFSFFDDTGIKICAKMYNETTKISCLNNIGDKDFESFELDQCASLYNESSVNECLKTNGVLRRKLPACINKNELSNLLKMTLDNLHAGNFSSVDTTLNNLLNSLSACE